jgi:hypothetical protein
MMNDRRPDEQAQRGSAGLCERCAHVQIVTSAKGSRFYLCRMSLTDSRFPRYPALPVLACDGFSPVEPAPDGA